MKLRQCLPETIVWTDGRRKRGRGESRKRCTGCHARRALRLQFHAYKPHRQLLNQLRCERVTMFFRESHSFGGYFPETPLWAAGETRTLQPVVAPTRAVFVHRLTAAGKKLLSIFRGQSELVGGRLVSDFRINTQRVLGQIPQDWLNELVVRRNRHVVQLIESEAKTGAMGGRRSRSSISSPERGSCKCNAAFHHR